MASSKMGADVREAKAEAAQFGKSALASGHPDDHHNAAEAHDRAAKVVAASGGDSRDHEIKASKHRATEKHIRESREREKESLAKTTVAKSAAAKESGTKEDHLAAAKEHMRAAELHFGTPKENEHIKAANEHYKAAREAKAPAAKAGGGGGGEIARDELGKFAPK